MSVVRQWWLQQGKHCVGVSKLVWALCLWCNGLRTRGSGITKRGRFDNEILELQGRKGESLSGRKATLFRCEVRINAPYFGCSGKQNKEEKDSQGQGYKTRSQNVKTDT